MSTCPFSSILPFSFASRIEVISLSTSFADRFSTLFYYHLTPSQALRHDLETSLPSLLIPEPVPVRGSKARAGRTLEPSHPTKAQPVKSSKVGAVGKIVITGDRRREVREWLEERGF